MEPFSATQLTDLLRYHQWATDLIVDAARSVSDEQRRAERASSFEGIGATLEHLFRSDSIWFDRLRELPAKGSDAYIASPDFEAFAADWHALHIAMIAWASALSAEQWRRELDYRTLRGDPSRSAIWEIIVHVVNHGTYHRGQVITLLRQAGGKTVSTDLIRYYRETAARAAG